VTLGSIRTRPQKLDLQFPSQILCATYVFSLFVGASLFTEAVRTTDQFKNKTSRSMNGHSGRNKMGRRQGWDNDAQASRDVRYWSKADVGLCTAHVRFRG
jgi:hypothetical protein